MTPNQVDIWRIDLAGHSNGIQQYRCLLSSDEIQRADRFHFEKDRRSFTVARAALREILSRYASLAAQDLCFVYGAKGKPELGGAAEQFEIRFNLSHSAEFALLAVTRQLRIGVDIERVNADSATQEIAERFFSPLEVQTLLAVPSHQRVEAFFSCWTRKEAYIKALGEGLSCPLDSFVVAFAPGVPAALLDVKNDASKVCWSMYNIEVSEGYKAALVVEGQGHQLRQLNWDRA